jgi:hypothetical protein
VGKGWLEDPIPLTELSPRARRRVEFAKALQMGADRAEYAWKYFRSVSTLYRWRKLAVTELAATEYGRTLGLRGSPDSSSKPIRRCGQCGEALPAASTKRRKYCGGTCRVTALPARRKSAA